jgi:3-oxoacyl-[acyl-carrier protein] reductase
MQLLEGKVALVTGAAQGIGEYTARAFCEEGATVILADIDVGRLRETGAGLAAAGHEVWSVALDVRDRARVKDAVADLIGRYGRIDVLVNNAGAYPRRHFLEMSDEEWDRVVDLNLNGTYNCSRAVAPHMVGRRGGAIVNIGSVTFFLGMAKLTHYVAAKGGIVGFTRSLARDLGDYGVRVNCITPGAVATESEKTVASPEEVAATILPLQCLKRRIVPEDIARVAVFLASHYSDGMTGQTLNVDGGWVLY